jgi:ParB family chromosome partitioning protein
VPPECCRPWALADRPESEFEHLDALTESFTKDGQLQPAVVRPVQDPADPGIRYEVIAGQARWRAAKRAGIPLKVLVNPEMDDESAFRAMVGENEFRKELSDYARARRFSVAIARGVYRSKGEMAERLRISPAALSRLLGFAELDTAIVAKVRDMRRIPASLGYALHVATGKGFLSQILRDIGRIEAGEIPRDSIPEVWEKEFEEAAAIFTRENSAASDAAAEAGAATARASAETVRTDDGRVICTLKEGAGRAITIRIPAATATRADEQFRAELADFLRNRLG